jgi:nicotinamidase-related amidase
VTEGRAALALIDMQEDVVHGRWWQWSPPVAGIVDRCVELVAACRARGVPVIFTAVEYHADGTNTPGAVAGGTPEPPEYLVEGTPGAELVPALRPEAGEVVAVKNLVSAFDAVGFSDALQASGADTLLVAGLAAEGGVAATVRDAHARGLRVVVVSDAVGAFSHERHDEHLRVVFPPLATVVSTAAAVAEVLPAPT